MARIVARERARSVKAGQEFFVEQSRVSTSELVECVLVAAAGVVPDAFYPCATYRRVIFLWRSAVTSGSLNAFRHNRYRLVSAVSAHRKPCQMDMLSMPETPSRDHHLIPQFRE